MHRAFNKFRNLTKSPTGDSQSNAHDDSSQENLTLLEGFEWYSRGDGQHWDRLSASIPALKSIGIDIVWLPPGCKATHPNSNGYDPYDLYDLGEFDQKGHVATKWGSFSSLLSLAQTANQQGVGLIWDAVLSHKAGADYVQTVKAQEVDPSDRRKAMGKPFEMQAWLGWDFAARAGKYSDFKLNSVHFNGTDWDAEEQKSGIFKVLGSLDGAGPEKDWARDVDTELGNFDFLLLNNYDLSRDDLKDDFVKWAVWISSLLKLKGFRYDAAKHMSRSFMKQHLQRVQEGRSEPTKEPLFMIGEYCSGSLETLVRYVDAVPGISLFDFPLHSNFVRISKSKDPDLRTLLQGSLMQVRPQQTVAHVTNHDSQRREGALATPADELVEEYFIPMAYALILYHQASHAPCVFWGDLYGVQGPGEGTGPECYGRLSKMIKIRKLYAYGYQREFPEKSTYGLIREGNQSHPAGLAMLMNVSKEPVNRRMQVGKGHAGEVWTDILGLQQTQVRIDSDGRGIFPAGAKMLSLWTAMDALGRQELDKSSL